MVTDTLSSVHDATDAFLDDDSAWEAPEPREDGYVALRSYGAIGDGRTVALIARDGQIDWLPFPSLPSDPVFSGIVDAADGGRVELRPVDDDYTVQRAYVPGTNVLRTRFRTSTGTVEVTDALVTGVAGRLPWGELARRVDGLDGSVDMRWAVVPGNAFGTHPIRRVDTVHGPVLRAADINLALVGFEHGRTDPTEPGDGEVEGPLEFRGAFTTSPGSRLADLPLRRRGRAAAPARPARRRRGHRPHDRELGGLVDRVQLGRPLGRRRAPQRARPQAAHLQPHRRHRRRRDDRAARELHREARTGTTASRGCATSPTRSTRSSGSACGRSPTPPSRGCSRP